MAELNFTKTHEWIEADGGTRKVGITDFAQGQLGDIVYVELPALGKVVDAGEELCVIESTKATASVYAPVAGSVAETNLKLAKNPELINSDPTGEGWLVKLAVNDFEHELLNKQEYDTFCESEAH